MGALLARLADVGKRVSLKILEMKKIFCMNTRHNTANEMVVAFFAIFGRFLTFSTKGSVLLSIFGPKTVTF